MIQERLPKAENSFLVKIIVIIIIISLLFSGLIGYLIRGNSNYIIKVNGIPISQLQLQQAFNEERDILKERLGDQFSTVISTERGIQMLRHQALERLINVTLISQYSKKLGLTVTDTQIKKDIYNMPIFQTDGAFDNEKYRFVLSQHNIDASDFAKEIRQNLINRQLSKIYITYEFVLPEEVNSYAKLLLERREVRIATLSFANYQLKQIVTNKELQDYYNMHKKNFILPEQVQVSYIKIDVDSQRENLVIEEEDLKNYYENNIANFTQLEKKHYSMIQLESEEEANCVSKALSSGADFKQLASEKSTDKFSAKNHGALGWMEVSTTPREIISANLTKKEQISEVIKLANNYVIFRLDDIKPALVTPFQIAKIDIAKILKNKKALDRFYSLRKIASQAAIDHRKSLSDVERDIGIKAVRTGWFSRDNLPKEIRFSEVANAIFSSSLIDKNRSTGMHFDIINIDDNCAFIIRVEKYKPEIVQVFDAVKREVVSLVKYNKAIKEMELDANKLLSALKQKKSRSMLLKLGIKFCERKIVERFRKRNELTEAVFQMTTPKDNTPTYFSVRDSQNNLLIIELLKVIQFQPTEEELKTFSQHYEMLLGNAMMESLMVNLRNGAKMDLSKMK